MLAKVAYDCGTCRIRITRPERSDQRIMRMAFRGKHARRGKQQADGRTDLNPEAFHDPLQHRHRSDANDAEVEALVLREDDRPVHHGPSLQESGLDGHQASDVRRRREHGGPCSRTALKIHAQIDDLVITIDSKARHPGDAAGIKLKRPFRNKAQQRLPHRRWTHVQFVREKAVDEPLPRRQLPLDQRVAQALIDLPCNAVRSVDRGQGGIGLHLLR